MYNEDMVEKKRHSWLKIILYALLITAAGFILLNIIFILYALFFNLFDLFMPDKPAAPYRWLPILRHISFLVIIGLISWPILVSRTKPLFKAIYLTVPTATLLVTIGILLNEWPVWTYIIGGLITAGILWYLYRKQQPWFYYYTIVLISAGLLVFNLAGGEI
jgi:hypothetical protein